MTAALRAGRRIVPMHGLFEVDITSARRLIAQSQPPLSLTAFVIASLGRAAAAHPEVHAYRDWRGRLIEHRHVDVQTLIEIPTEQGPFGLVHVVRDADIRSVADISAELRMIKADPASTRSGRMLTTVAPLAGRIPGLYRTMFAAMTRSRRVHLSSGTVQLTAVGMFAGGGGFAIAPTTLASLVVVVGGLSRRPCTVDGALDGALDGATDGAVEVRDVLDLTVTVDHNVVDGAPATRFGADLRRILHTAAVLAPPGDGGGERPDHPSGLFQAARTSQPVPLPTAVGDTHGMAADPLGVTALGTSACWTLLRTVDVGRLAVCVEGLPDIFPVNFVVDHGTVVFRTAAGTKLAAALANPDVAFEVDGYYADTDEAWSVVVKGRAEKISDLQELLDTTTFPLSPWHAAPKPQFVRIEPGEVSGRRFPVVDPAAWRTVLTDAPHSSPD